jgi:hypothetical protein
MRVEAQAMQQVAVVASGAAVIFALTWLLGARVVVPVLMRRATAAAVQAEAGMPPAARVQME